MRLLNGPLARVLGSAVSWLLFTVCFTLLFQVSAVVMGLGGFCASGGPYVIETQCPDAVVVFAPLSIFGGLIAAAIALFFARGFGTPLVIWAWPILFVGLGIDFLLAAIVPGGLANLIVGIVFVAMGMAPLLLVWRVGAARLLIGTTDAHDRPFLDGRGPTPIFSLGSRADDEDAAPATAGDWLRALAVSVPAILLGCGLGLTIFRAAAQTGG
ncbi:hypothetical protein [uncultured Microbacterium sp.]|uniref:hypothetical protein n=1 Tax=uncultured Microbacterium sp. TaxID=191216 RepID=UPI0028D4539C|nr:hypothetical protein [uncultured Microbacterium sp.]